ncbi:MAG: thioredoxin-like domain-containing protein [Pseudomonadota bacterium]
MNLFTRIFSTLALLLAFSPAHAQGKLPEKAPEIARPGLQWLNVAAPIPLEQLRGRLVILDFWTLGCINCVHIIPTLRALEERYPDKIVVIGVHSPKFEREKSIVSVRDAIRRYEIHHPVIHDPEMQLWQAYGVEAWPTLVFVGADGKLLGQVQGEPEPQQFNRLVTDLLKQSSGKLKPQYLALKPLEAVQGRFSFPGKLKSVPGVEKRWALADAGHNQIVLLNDKGADIRRFGSGKEGFADGAANKASFHHPQGLIATDEAIYVADTGNHAIRKIDLATGNVSTLAGTGQRGTVLANLSSGKTTALASPWDLERKGQQIYFANAGTHQIGVLNLADNKVAMFAGSGAEELKDGAAREVGFAQPSGLVISADGLTLYVADSESSAIRTITLNNKPMVKTLVGAGLFDFGRTNGTFKVGRLQHPLGVAVEGQQLLVADTYNNAIRSLDLAAKQISEFDGGAYTCMDPVCIPTREPAGIVIDGKDRVLLVDTGNQRIEEYRPSSKTYRTWAR